MKCKVLLIALLTLSLPVNAQNAQAKDTKAEHPAEAAMTQHDVERFATVMAQIQHYHIKKVDYSELFDSAISGMLHDLDPHSEYLDSKSYKALKNQTSGHYGGIGAVIAPENGVIRVVSPLDDSPAFKAGIEPQDMILKIDDHFIRDVGPAQALNLLMGPPKSKVKLTIYRAKDDKTLALDLTREIIKIHSVKTKWLDDGIAFARITTFDETCVTDLKNHLLDMNKKHAIRGIVLDLRNNPGGLLTSATGISDLFLDTKQLKSDIIVSTKGRTHDANMVFRATPGEILPNVPMVILINRGSASASEIVASALSEHKRAITLGTTSFGKGSVQTVIPTSETEAIKLTTALYYTPNGNPIQAEGVHPDVVVPYTHLPKTEEPTTEMITESQLYRHLKAKPKSLLKENSMKKVNTSDLAHKDFQLFQAVKLIEGMLAIQK